MEPRTDTDAHGPEIEGGARGMGAAEWIQNHIYTTACIGVGIFLIIGALVVKQHMPETVSGTLQAWGGGGALVNAASYDAHNPVLGDLASSYDTANTISFSPIPVSLSSTTSAESFDIGSLITSLHLSTASRASVQTTSDTSGESYAYIPQGLISIPTARARTPEQQALYQYGNDAGSYIQSYEDGHRNTAPILADQIADRQNSQKGQAVKDIGTALAGVGAALKGMDDVPEGVQALNQALAQSYIEIGTKLSAVPDAPGDDTFITAIKAYNAAADSFIKNYVAVAQYLSLSGVVFAPTDPGSVFAFSGGGGL